MKLIASLAPVVRRRLHEDVGEQLLRAIQAGDFAAGSRLPSERELSGIFGVTRPVIREALQWLQRLGILQISHGERAEVIRVTPESIVERFTESVRTLIATDADALDHFKEARLAFECGVARMAADRATTQDLSRLRQILDEGQAAAARRPDFVALDGEFHATVAELTGNPLFPAVSRGIFNWLSVYDRASVHMPGREFLTLQEHEAIFDRLDRRDANGAESAMRRHLTRANDLYRHAPELDESDTKQAARAAREESE
jgi:GntR family transcriptional regulator, sialic acid-inducible nan operon repressor